MSKAYHETFSLNYETKDGRTVAKAKVTINGEEREFNKEGKDTTDVLKTITEEILMWEESLNPVNPDDLEEVDYDSPPNENFD